MEFVNEMIKGDHISSPSEEEMECKAAVVTVKKSVAQRVQKIVSENASVERRSSARLRNRPENKRPYYGHSSSEDVKDDGSRKNTKLRKRRELEYDVVEETECCKTGPVLERLGEVKVYADATCGEDVQKMDERGDHNPTDAVGKSAYARVKETLRMFNTHYLHFVQEEEKRCRKDEVDAKKVARGSKSEKEYSGYTFPLAVAIVLSGQYEDDLDNSEDVVYTGQGGNNLLGNKRQVKDQVMERGNLALKNSLEQCVPVRVIRGHESTSSYCGKVYTYDGLYKVVEYWPEKGVSGFTVFRYRLRRVEGQPVLTTNQVHYTRAHVPNSLSELRGLVSSDISGGLEDIPIPATNLVDDPPVAPEGKFNLIDSSPVYMYYLHLYE
ncbi:uncharacterized protein LOC122076744 isoform X2 [Macadamia integrifolia]|uniref:uncharacterized protein LOC122076744 isoform X2 n=1 Tax=Macadamia integrifolia TaxID=60698 RepID=UPI001C4E5C7F|nr:uncharacterized protein LOC122076744 isoform X2 [Macadamia integrifolia]